MKIILAPIDQIENVRDELGSQVVKNQGRLFVVPDQVHSYWAQNIWLDVQELKFDSISVAVKHLRAIQRNWWLHSVNFHRRAQLIQAQLPPLKAKAIEFLADIPRAPLGAFTLWDEKTLYYAARCASPLPDGELHFIENRTDPPSRAYLKLWDYFTITGHYPKPNERVMDLGSSPGGWTWVLDQLGCEVLSVDKAPLAPDLRLSQRVRSIEESAFGLDPAQVGPVDWLFSDIICYPERLLQLVQRWRASGLVKNFMCTLKFQGPTNMDIVHEFLKIPGSEVRHLFHNKHELTWSLRENSVR